MSTSQTPITSGEQSLASRIKRFGQRLTGPHQSIQELGLARRVRLLNVISLLLIAAAAFGLATRPEYAVIFDFLLGISIVSFLLGKSTFPRIGIIVFSAGIISSAYLYLYLGLALDYLTTVLAFVPIALIFASVLMDHRAFAGLAIYATTMTVLVPLYSITPISTNDVREASSMVFFMGAILYGVLVFRSDIEKERLKETRNINQKLQEVKINLEERIEEHARELGKANLQIQERSVRLQIVSDISQEISSNVEQQPGELLARIARSISEKLGFYHVGIFLLDENREYAVLRAANSQGGQRMLERHHQLKVGGTGIVGYVSQAGRPRIALDTGSDAVFFNNPDLPKTRSEIALPLKYGTNVIGVLDAQSTLPSAFKDEDLNILGTLANQIAIIINNRMVNENQNYALPSTKDNKFANRKQRQDGYYYLPDGTISTASTPDSALLERVLASGETEIVAQPSKGNPSTLAVPVKFRDQVIGIIQIQAAEADRKWTEDEIIMVQSIADRAAFALENARLFEETIRRAEQEETIARVTTQIGASTDFDRILQTTIQELGLALGVSRSFIQLGASGENGKEETFQQN